MNDISDITGERPTLFVIGGLPATGKSTIASRLAREVGAAFVRIDTIEHAIVSTTSLTQPVGPVGYTVGYLVAADQLRAGLSVVAESVNPVEITRRTWRQVGADAGADVVEVEVVCSDAAEHRRRAETRTVDIPGLETPSWQQIVDREYEPWQGEHLVIDTAAAPVADGVAAIRAAALTHQARGDQARAPQPGGGAG